jgi:hypothetical protein
MFASTKLKLWPEFAKVVVENDYGKEVHCYEFHEDIRGCEATYISMMNKCLVSRRLCISDMFYHPWIQSKETQYAELRDIVKKKTKDPNMIVIRRSNVGAMASVMEKLAPWDHIVIDPLSNNVYLTPVQINASLPNRFINPTNGSVGYVGPIGIRLKAGLHGNYNPAFHVARVIVGVKDACRYLDLESDIYIDAIKANIPRIMGTGKTVILPGIVASMCNMALEIRDRIGTHYVGRSIGGKTNAQASAKAQELLFSVQGVDVSSKIDGSFNPFDM